MVLLCSSLVSSPFYSPYYRSFTSCHIATSPTAMIWILSDFQPVVPYLSSYSVFSLFMAGTTPPFLKQANALAFSNPPLPWGRHDTSSDRGAPWLSQSGSGSYTPSGHRSPG